MKDSTPGEMLAEMQKASMILETQRVKRAQGGIVKGWVNTSRLLSCRRREDKSNQSTEKTRGMKMMCVFANRDRGT